MGIRSAKSPDLIDLESLEEVEGCHTPPSAKYEAVVRYLVSQKFGTIAALCEATELTRPSVQGRILKGQELGTKVLTALARACGVTFKDLTELPIKQLRAKIDTHLAAGSEEPEKQSTSNEPLVANAYLSFLLMHHNWINNLGLLQSPSEESPDEYIVNFYTSSLFVGREGFDLDSHGKPQSLFAPSCPPAIRISLCGLLSPNRDYFENQRESKKKTPTEEYFAYVFLIVGKEEKRRFQEIITYVLEVRNLLNASFTPNRPKFSLLVINDDFDGHSISTHTNYVSKLKPLLADEVIEIDHSKLDGDSKTYSMELILKILAVQNHN